MEYLTNFRPSFLLNSHQLPHKIFSFFSSELFDFELTRILGTTGTGGCDIAEFLDAVGRIRKNDPDSWFRAWHEQGERAEQIAADGSVHGQRALARRAYLRASNYFRAAPYLLSHPDGRILACAERAIRNFRRALLLMECRVLDLEIPYGDNGVRLPGYLYLPPESKQLSVVTTDEKDRDGKIPVLLNLGGADSTKEELYFMFGDPGPELGYAVLTFDGPGQGQVLRQDKLPLIPDFERVTATVLDHLQRLVERNPADLPLDMDRIAVAGATAGGYYALRAATDPRIKACVSVDPFYSLWEVALTRMPAWFAHLWLHGWISDDFLNWSIRTHVRVDFPTRWEFSLGKWIMGCAYPTQVLRRFRDFSLDRPIAPPSSSSSSSSSPPSSSTEHPQNHPPVPELIHCPVLLTGAGHTIYASAETSTLRIYHALTRVPEANKEVWVPSDAADGGLTGKVGAWALLAQKSFGFLDRHLGVKREIFG